MNHKKAILFSIYFCVISGFCVLHFQNHRKSLEKITSYSHQYQLQSEAIITPVDINKISVSKFAKLPGVSRAIAEQIISYRDNHGNFQEISEIITAGMPETLFYELQDYFYITESLPAETKSDSTKKSPKTTQKTTQEITIAVTTESDSEIISESDELLFTDATEPEIIFPLELNQASVEEFCALPGIGTVTALAIVEYRESIGGFINRYQLLDVSGIGEIKFSEILPYIYLETEYPLPEEEPITELTDPTEAISETIPEIPMINLNTATKEDLLLLPDCNDALAEEIIILRDRDIHVFYNILEITLAEHVTTELFSKWMPYLTVDDDGSTQIPYVPPLAQDSSS